MSFSFHSRRSLFAVFTTFFLTFSLPFFHSFFSSSSSLSLLPSWFFVKAKRMSTDDDGSERIEKKKKKEQNEKHDKQEEIVSKLKTTWRFCLSLGLLVCLRHFRYLCFFERLAISRCRRHLVHLSVRTTCQIDSTSPGQLCHCSFFVFFFSLPFSLFVDCQFRFSYSIFCRLLFTLQTQQHNRFWVHEPLIFIRF